MAQSAQTADRALELLLLAASSEEPMALADLGRASGLNKATTYRLVQSLVKYSMLARETDGRRYTVGPGLVALSATVMQRVNIRESARPILERIAVETSETVSLHIRHIRHRVCVDSIQSNLPVRRVVPMGETLPLYAGTTSKVMLAFLDDEEITEILSWASSEGQDTKPIAARLQQVRDDGYLCAVGDRNVGVGGLSAPVFSPTGVTGAITVSGPSDRFDIPAMEAAAPFLRLACAELSEALGRVAGTQPGVEPEPIAV